MRRLPLPLSALALALSAAFAPSTSAASTDALGAWKAYALRGLTPDFAWAERPAVERVTPTVVGSAFATRSAVMPALRFGAAEGSPLRVGVSQAFAGDTPGTESGGLGASQLLRQGQALERTFVAPSLTRAIGDSTSLTGAVVFAHQQFATLGLGWSTSAELLPPTQLPLSNESSVGTGVRIQLDEQLGERLGFRAAYQSKVDMDAFQSYRGVFADPGDFDIPAVAAAGLSWAVAPGHALGVDVQRVMYSDISVFTSGALPIRFLSLLGDGGSPVFAWRDLTLYSLDYAWQASPVDTLMLRWTSQQQPVPTSTILEAALADEFTDNNLALIYTRRFSDFGSLRLGASYAPAQYFLGNASYTDRDGGGDQVEVEAVWTVAF